MFWTKILQWSKKPLHLPETPANISTFKNGKFETPPQEPIEKLEIREWKITAKPKV